MIRDTGLSLLLILGFMTMLSFASCTNKIVKSYEYYGVILKGENSHPCFRSYQLKDWTPQKSDVAKAEIILKEYLKGNQWLSLDLKSYSRQYVGAIDQNQEVIFIRGLCVSPKLFKREWRRHLVNVSDGGDCFFMAKICLDKNTCCEFSINSEA